MDANPYSVNTTTGEVYAESTMSPTIGKLVTALVNVQSKMAPAKKDSENPFFKSRYADLSSCWDVARDLLGASGLAVIQTNAESQDYVTIITMLAHTSGEWIKGTLTMKPSKNDPQGVGSCITYGRRYALSAILGICTEDDDGNAASQPSGKVIPRTIDRTTIKPKESVPTYDYSTGERMSEINPNTGEVFEDVPHTVGQTLSEPNVKSEGRCEFGKDKGASWVSMTPKKLMWYRDLFMSNINDPEKAKYKSGNEAKLQEVLDALEAR